MQWIAPSEKDVVNVNLCRMNLAVHGLEGDIRQAITYYEDLHQGTGRFDCCKRQQRLVELGLVLANQRLTLKGKQQCHRSLRTRKEK